MRTQHNTLVKRLLFISTLLLTVACGPTPQEIAQQKFKRAHELFSQEQFNDAKIVLDSIISEFPKEIEFVARAEDLMRTIKIGEQERNLTFLDSAISKKEKELKALMKNFIVSNDYGKKEILIHKRQKPQNSYSRTYLRAHLDMKGNFYISSRYSGNSYIHHNKIKVYNKGQSVTSEKIPEGAFDNIQFEDQGTYWEVVNYKNGADNGIIDFIAQNVNKPLKVQFMGKKNYYIVMEKFDKEAIADGYEISFVLKDIARIKKEIDNVKKELNRLK
ncbi:hypothetical protein [Saccharicrinis fermentans]|uniref:Lipoprotein n=1 Tax=Saccharicrinis fermentans DSM 9555 = JCM 21142 TaxID=869213 RepID=W7YKU2_9BACT|nr:hypothetical protein [Saccharicrinis fermentans]GAF05136.1 hypothetical protein JCM21142_93860 [Saccharicrinis fermentans DSM 9555 = JCM 21142]